MQNEGRSSVACNPCCSWNLKDGAVTVGIWSMIYCLIQLAIFGWQMAAIKYEKDRASNILLPNFYEYGRYDVPSYYESYWQSPEERFYIGLFVVQIICLISSFFLLFASITLIYGAHTFSQCLVWPWIPCMLASILSSLAYCIIWWAGDVRDYWLILTILEMIVIFINFYCVIVIIIFYRYMSEEIHNYEKKGLEDFVYDDSRLPDMRDHCAKRKYKTEVYSRGSKYNAEIAQMTPQRTYSPKPYREGYSHLSEYAHEPCARVLQRRVFLGHTNEDRVSSWIKEQERMKMRGETNSEPASPTRKKHLPDKQHSLSVPSIYGDLYSCCHRHHNRYHHRKRHHHRSSSRYKNAEKEQQSKRCNHKRILKHLKSPEYSLSSDSSSANSTDAMMECGHRSCSFEELHNFSTDSIGTCSKIRSRWRHIHRKGISDGIRKTNSPCDTVAEQKSRTSKSPITPSTQSQRGTKNVRILKDAHSLMSDTSPSGIAIPQHIIIPASNGTLDANGRIQPQTYQINSEIRISYDQSGRPVTTSVERNPALLSESLPMQSSLGRLYTVPSGSRISTV